MTKDAIIISYTIATFFGIVFLSLGLCKRNKRKSHRQWGSKPNVVFRCVVHLGKPDRTQRELKTIRRLDLKRLTYRNTANEESECTPCLDFLVTLEFFLNLTEIKPVKLEKITPIIGKKYLFPHTPSFFSGHPFHSTFQGVSVTRT